MLVYSFIGSAVFFRFWKLAKNLQLNFLFISLADFFELLLSIRYKYWIIEIFFIFLHQSFLFIERQEIRVGFNKRLDKILLEISKGQSKLSSKINRFDFLFKRNHRLVELVRSRYILNYFIISGKFRQQVIILVNRFQMYFFNRCSVILGVKTFQQFQKSRNLLEQTPVF